MKRRIEVQAGEVRVTATLNVVGLTRAEVERVRSDLADRLQMAVVGLPYHVGVALNRVRVK